jgi:asparagine synthase (glutamine-hydrolysing)
VAAWLRGPLREWAGDLLSADALRRDGLLTVAPITTAWQEHQSGQRNWATSLWSILMFQAWRNA